MLTETKIKAAKPADKRYKLPDANGLVLRVMPNGTKSWIFRATVNGRRREKVIGKWPAMSLAKARLFVSEAHMQIDRGGNPFASQPARVNGTTFAAVAHLMIEDKKATITPKHMETLLGRLHNYILPALGAMPIDEIRPADVRTLLQPMITLGKLETANRVRMIIGEIFRYAILRDLTLHDPTIALKGLIKRTEVRSFAHISDRAILGRVLRDMDQSDAMLSVQQALRLLPYVFVRPGELRGARVEEFDLEHGVWRIPAERMKKRRLHLVPLSTQVKAQLEQIFAIRGTSGLLFPGARSWVRPISDAAMNVALKNLGYTSDIIVPHGFRGTASTMLYEMGYSSEIIEKQLAHEESNKVKSAYNHAEYLTQRHEMMQRWADFLDQCRAQAVA